MDYARFVALRGPLWDDFEGRLEAARAGRSAVGHEDLETLAFLYRQVLHDHARAGARFPETGAARRLRRLALEGTHWLQREPGTSLPGLLRGFRREFPRAFRRQLAPLGVAAGLFGAAILFGFSLAVAQPGLGTALLGPEAVAGLREGRLWTESLVSVVPPAVSSSAIATNNMSVALAAWAGGALAGLGSLYVVAMNGFLLGAIFGVTLHYQMTGALAAFVAAHGPLELTLILVAAGAGLGLGRALIAAEERPRRDVVRDASRDALIVMLGCLPWFLVLGLVEAVVSPAPGVPAAVKAALGAVLESLFLYVAFSPTPDHV